MMSSSLSSDTRVLCCKTSLSLENDVSEYLWMVKQNVDAVGSLSMIFVIVDEREAATMTGTSMSNVSLMRMVPILSLYSGNFSTVLRMFSKYFELRENSHILWNKNYGKLEQTNGLKTADTQL